MFAGLFRTKLNSRSRQSASVFATAMVVLHPSFLYLYPLLAYEYLIKYYDWLKSEECTFLACVSLGAGHTLSFLANSGHNSTRFQN